MDIWGTYTTKHLYRPAADCTGGTAARFFLYPLVIHDRDQDGKGHVIFRAVQLTGTGVMTARSSVTSITVVDNPGYTLRVMKAGQTYAFDANDQLTNAWI